MLSLSHSTRPKLLEHLLAQSLTFTASLVIFYSALLLALLFTREHQMREHQLGVFKESVALLIANDIKLNLHELIGCLAGGLCVAPAGGNGLCCVDR